MVNATDLISNLTQHCPALSLPFQYDLLGNLNSAFSTQYIQPTSRALGEFIGHIPDRTGGVASDGS